jgi:hypothetical protein
MIPSTMDRDKFKTNIGRTIQFIPHPRRDSTNGLWESDMNTWIVQGETSDKKGFVFLNAIRDHDPFILVLDQMRNFDAPDKLVLRGQIILKGNSVLFEPFHPKPASLSIPNANLNLSLDGANENGIVEISASMFDSLIFRITNEGEQSVRDYRTTILVPQAFTRPTSPSYIKDLEAQGEIIQGELCFNAYGSSITRPIYKKQSEKIGELLLKADPGDYIIRWQIHCDDGVFPTETTFGEIKVRVSPFSDLVKRAEEHLGR